MHLDGGSTGAQAKFLLARNKKQAKYVDNKDEAHACMHACIQALLELFDEENKLIGRSVRQVLTQVVLQPVVQPAVQIWMMLLICSSHCWRERQHFFLHVAS